LIKSGDLRRAGAFLVEMAAAKPLRHPARGLGWLAARRFLGDDPSDMLITIEAEDAFDAEPDLHRIQAPTLVLGGTGDDTYSEDLFRRTASGIPNGRAVIFPGKGHVYPTSSKSAVSTALGFLLG